MKSLKNHSLDRMENLNNGRELQTCVIGGGIKKF